MTSPPAAPIRGVPKPPAGLARPLGRVVVCAPDAAAVCAALAGTDASVHPVTDLRQALDTLRERPAANVLVLDGQSPAAPVALACGALHSDVRLAATWVVALVDTWEAGAAALADGADDCVVRPFGDAEMAARAELGVHAARERAGEHLLRELMAHVPGVLYRSAWDRGYTIELISDEIERITGYPASDFLESQGRTLMSIMHPDDREPVTARAADATDGRSFVLEYRLVCADGSVRWMVDRGQLVRGAAGRLWMDGVIVDVTDLREAEHRVRRRAVELARVEELRASPARIVAAADAARRRIERDLHDGAQQRLVTVRLQLSLARRVVETNPAAGLGMIEAINEELRLALAELRELARGIHPATLSERGLRPAVDALAMRCPVPVEIEGLPDGRFAAGTEAAAYFTIAEALTNVAKYAGADCATIRGAIERDALVVEVRDDGVGGADAGDGSGLTGLADRVRAQGGTLSVMSPPGAGTTVRAVLPLDGAAA
jgi:PAS domain S-box-containing protein